MEVAYAEAFARYGVPARVEGVRDAVRTTWAEVSSRQAAGQERWGGTHGGEHGFWRCFVQAVFTRAGGGLLPDALHEDLVDHFRDQSHWAIYPEVPPVLARLRRAGLRLLVVSNWDSSLPQLLDRLGLSESLDGIVVSALVGASKPDTRIFATALERAGVAAHEAVHVGDSAAEDYEGARRAGIHAVLLDRSGVAPRSFRSIRSLEELVPLLLKAA